MAKRDEYKVGQPYITRAAGANFLAEHLFSRRKRRAAYKRFHARIGQAQKKGNLPPDLMKVDLFFGWAVEQAGCLPLRRIPGIPISAPVYVTGTTSFASAGGNVSAVSLHTNCEELKLLYVAEVQRREAAELENLELKKKLADIEHQKKVRKSTFSSFGRQGGRGNAK